MNKYEKAIVDWEAIPAKKRTRKVAHTVSKSVGMRSMLEVYIARDLADLQRAKSIRKFEYEPEVWEYQHKVSRYTPDFKVTMADGSVQYYEAKGKMTDETRKKLVSIKRCNPCKDLKIIFERAGNKLKAGGKMTYGTWADKEGYEWNEKTISEDWYNGRRENIRATGCYADAQHMETE